MTITLSKDDKIINFRLNVGLNHCYNPCIEGVGQNYRILCVLRCAIHIVTLMNVHCYLPIISTLDLQDTRSGMQSKLWYLHEKIFHILCVIFNQHNWAITMHTNSTFPNREKQSSIPFINICSLPPLSANDLKFSISCKIIRFNGLWLHHELSWENTKCVTFIFLPLFLTDAVHVTVGR